MWSSGVVGSDFGMFNEHYHHIKFIVDKQGSISICSVPINATKLPCRYGSNSVGVF